MRPSNDLDPSTLPIDVKSCRRLVSYLLRATFHKNNISHLTGHRAANLPRELADCLVPLVVSERSPLAWYNALLRRFDISVADTSADGNRWPLEAWLPDGRIRWDMLLTRVAYRDLHVVLDENPQFFATFATSYPADSTLEQLMFDSYPDPVNATTSIADLSAHRLPVRAYRSLWTCEEPMSHGADGKSGNVTMFRRERAIDRRTGKVVLIPLYAGNAVRGMLRDIGFRRALSLLDVDPLDIPPMLAHQFFSGGGIESGSGGNTVDMTIERTAREMMPMWDLFAGCLDNRAMRGRIAVHDAALVCRENAWLVHQVIAPDMPLDDYAMTLQEAASLTQLRLGTRHAHKEFADAEGAQMLFNTEVVIKGAQWVHSIQVGAGVSRMNPVTVSCLSDLLVEFASIGALGAQTSKMGQAEIGEYVAGEGVPALPSPNAYVEYMKANRGPIREWLMRGGRPVSSAIGTPTDAPVAKGAKVRKTTAKEVLAEQKAREEQEALVKEGVL